MQHLKIFHAFDLIESEKYLILYLFWTYTYVCTVIDNNKVHASIMFGKDWGRQIKYPFRYANFYFYLKFINAYTVIIKNIQSRSTGLFKYTSMYVYLVSWSIIMNCCMNIYVSPNNFSYTSAKRKNIPINPTAMGKWDKPVIITNGKSR